SGHTPGTHAGLTEMRRSRSNTKNSALVFFRTSCTSGDAGGPKTRMSIRNDVNGEMPAPAPRSGGQMPKFGGAGGSPPSTVNVSPLSAGNDNGIPSGSADSKVATLPKSGNDTGAA